MVRKLAVVAAVVLAVAGLPGWPRAAVGAPAGLRLHVAGRQLADARGRVVQVDGFSHSGSEYACAEGWGIFDGPTGDGAIRSMLRWHPRMVRLPLNEDCWLGINGVRAEYAGRSYRRAIAGYVHRLERHGLAVDLDLHWNAPGTTRAMGQQPMADADHSPAFWRSVARAFGNDRAVLFELYNEPHDISWSCWRNGCRAYGYRIAGMQSLVNAVRSTGVRNVILVGGLGWSGDLSGWLKHRPRDPAHQMAAVAHVYDMSACKTRTCWNAHYAPVARRFPLVTTEVGETDCAGGFVTRYLHWADAHRVSYLGWTWNTWDCRSGPALITSYDGTPTAFGAAIRKHFTTRFPD